MLDWTSEIQDEHFLNNDHMLPASQPLAMPNSSLEQLFPGNFYYYVLTVDSIFCEFSNKLRTDVKKSRD